MTTVRVAEMDDPSVAASEIIEGELYIDTVEKRLKEAECRIELLETIIFNLETGQLLYPELVEAVNEIIERQEEL